VVCGLHVKMAFILFFLLTISRYGYVFLYLDTPKTLSRYEAQFTNYAHYISTYGLVRSIIINEEYLRGTPEKTYGLILRCVS
jgi:hypothetical protein